VHLNDYVIRIKTLENGFMVEVPDMEAIKKKYKDAEKQKNGMSSVYTGDLTESYAAKSVAEVLKLVKAALSQIPESDYAAAFEEATTKGT